MSTHTIRRFKTRSGSVEEFVRRHGNEVSAQQLYFSTAEPLAAGTDFTFEIYLQNDSLLLRGDATALWAGIPPQQHYPGNVSNLRSLAPESEPMLEYILEAKEYLGIEGPDFYWCTGPAITPDPIRTPIWGEERIRVGMPRLLNADFARFRDPQRDMSEPAARQEFRAQVAHLRQGKAEVEKLHGDLIDAEKLYRSALFVWDLEGPSQKPDAATTLHGLATTLETQNRFAEAEPILRRALHIRERTLPPEHSLIQQTAMSLSMLLATKNV